MVPSCYLAASERIPLAFEPAELGEGMFRQHRHRPVLSASETDALEGAWRQRRPGAEHGDVRGRPGLVDRELARASLRQACGVARNVLSRGKRAEDLSCVQLGAFEALSPRSSSGKSAALVRGPLPQLTRRGPHGCSACAFFFLPP